MSKTVTILVGTGNAHKLDEITAALEPLQAGGLGFRVVGADILRDAGVPDPGDVEETGETFAENAEIKARAFARCAAALPIDERPDFVLADDSGLAVDALGGAPGVRSARYSGEESTDQQNNAKLLEALRDVPEEKRGAAFHCVMACVRIPHDEHSAPELAFRVDGRCPGRILPEPRGEGGFGYDPVFFYPPLGCAFAELSRARKTAVSHRGLALAQLCRDLPAHISG